MDILPNMPAPNDPLEFYDLESFLFQKVHARFHEQGWIDAFDFFAIVIWKSNRAKPRIAQRLLDQCDEGTITLEDAVRRLTGQLSLVPEPKERLRVLLKVWRFQLPTATAVLSVLWPEEFSVYDARVCEQLGAFKSLAGQSDFEKLWTEYSAYVRRVRAENPGVSLRDGDRRLWARSVVKQLALDLETRFGVARGNEGPPTGSGPQGRAAHARWTSPADLRPAEPRAIADSE